ncbi:hypothetical protein GCM10020221_12880 [Streptomyces thioluteus]|uniref:Uncharacterized protein n=1 Tax=Streptomyces thioluteus TaxID=66431 RepID=A0ABP6J2K3_STRTU
MAHDPADALRLGVRHAPGVTTGGTSSSADGTPARTPVPSSQRRSQATGRRVEHGGEGAGDGGGGGRRRSSYRPGAQGEFDSGRAREVRAVDAGGEQDRAGPDESAGGAEPR